MPSEPQSFDLLKASAPPGLEIVAIQWSGRHVWLSIPGLPGDAVLIRAMAGPGVEIVRYYDESDAVLQALADYWRCSLVSRHDERERFDPAAVTA